MTDTAKTTRFNYDLIPEQDWAWASEVEDHLNEVEALQKEEASQRKEGDD